MADEIVEKLKLLVDTDEANARVKEIGEAFEKLFTTAGIQAVAFNQGLNLVIGGLEKFAENIEAGFKANEKFEQQTRLLSNTLKGMGQNAGELTLRYRENAEQLEKMTGHQSEAILQVEAMAARFGVGSTQMQGYTEAAIRLSNVTGQDLNSAMQDLLRLQLTGQTRNIDLKNATQDLTESQLKSGDAIGVINEKMRDQLGVMLEGKGGAMLGLNLGWENLGKAIAKAVDNSAAFVAIAGAATTAMNTMADVLMKHGLLAGAGALLDIAFTGGEVGALRFTEKEHESNIEAQKKQREEAAKEAGDFSKWGAGQGGFNLSDINTDKKKPMIDFSKMMEEGWKQAEEDYAKESKSAADSLKGAWAEYTKSRETYFKQLQDARIKDSNQEFELNRRSVLSMKEIKAQLVSNIEQIDVSKEAYHDLAMAGHGMTNLMAEAFTKLVLGQKVNLAEMLDGFLKMMGQRLIAQGIEHEFMGAAGSLLGLPTAPGVAAIGIAEIASGTAMLAGSLLLPDGGKVATSGGGGGASRDFAGGSTGGRGRGFGGGDTSGQPSTIVVNVNGVLTAGNAGREIAKAISNSKRMGLM